MLGDPGVARNHITFSAPHNAPSVPRVHSNPDALETARGERPARSKDYPHQSEEVKEKDVQISIGHVSFGVDQTLHNHTALIDVPSTPQIINNTVQSCSVW